MDPIEKCSVCSAPMPKGFDRICTRCGWDNLVGMRKCVKCKDAVVLNEAIGYGPIGGVVGIGGLILWRLFGLLLGGAIVCAIGSLCGIITSVAMRYKCSSCDKKPEGRLLSAEERKSLRMRRLGFLVGAILLAAGSITLFILFAGAMSL